MVMEWQLTCYLYIQPLVKYTASRDMFSSNMHKFAFVSLSVQSSHSVMSDSLRPRELQHTRPPCPSPTPRVHSNSHPSSRWCHPAISSSVYFALIYILFFYKHIYSCFLWMERYKQCLSFGFFFTVFLWFSTMSKLLVCASNKSSEMTLILNIS